MSTEDRYFEIINFVKRKISIIDNIDDYAFKLVCIFSLIECFAQEYSNYPSKNPEQVFCDFICRYQYSYSYLDKVDPITLYYEFEDILKEKYSLNFLQDGCIYTPQDLVESDKEREMELFLMNAGYENRIKQHKYIHLLYKMRNKLSHELHYNSWSKISDKWDSDKPSFISFGSENITWQLGFPYIFIKSLTLECVEAFLLDRQNNLQDPFMNNRNNRKHILTWSNH